MVPDCIVFLRQWNNCRISLLTNLKALMQRLSSPQAKFQRCGNGLET
jgi:hypothetical protein